MRVTRDFTRDVLLRKVPLRMTFFIGSVHALQTERLSESPSNRTARCGCGSCGGIGVTRAASTTGVRAVTHMLPVALPFLAPRKWAMT